MNKKDVYDAIRKYKNGERPFRFTKPRAWYVLCENGYPYPLKYIYALAINQPPNEFNTSTPISVFKRLGVEICELTNPELEFYVNLNESLADSKVNRQKRLANANKKPERKIVETIVFIRNPDVVAEVLERANGICEKCENKAPFLRKSDSSPYLEVHHKIRLADDGEDTVENAIALCPNCHREAHYG